MIIVIYFYYNVCNQSGKCGGSSKALINLSMVLAGSLEVNQSSDQSGNRSTTKDKWLQ